MTNDEASKLNFIPGQLFIYYHGETVSGTLCSHFGEREKWSIVPPGLGNLKDDPWKTVEQFGIPIPDIQMLHQVANSLNINEGNARYSNGRIKAKKFIIVGAGASFDFNSMKSANEVIHPPLTNELFKQDHIGEEGYYPGVSALTNDLFGSDNIERYFQREWDKLKKAYNPLLLSQLINVQYYIHHLFFVLSQYHRNYSRNNYTSLVKAAHDYSLVHPDEIIVFISYNYDTLLESAITSFFGIEFNTMDDYVDAVKNKVIVFKPHGSSNWVRRLDQNKVYSKFSNLKSPTGFFPLSLLAQHLYRDRMSIKEILDTTESNDIHVANDLAKIFHDGTGKTNMANQGTIVTTYPYFPYIIIPYKDKDEFVMPRSHKFMLESYLDQAEDILIIGWKGEESKMQNLMKEKLLDRSVRITNISSLKTNAENKKSDIQTTFRAILPNAVWHNKHIGFTGFVKELINTSDHFFS